MTRLTFALIGAAALALSPSALAAERCAGTTATDWTAAGKGWVIEASADGPTCDNAVATLIIRNPAGEPVYWTSQVASQTMVLAGKTGPKELGAGLKEWTDPNSSTIQTADALPEWKKGTESPGAGSEFPFYPDEGLTQEDYEAIRATKAPTFCFVQGMESLDCLVLGKDGVLTSVGVQSFPG